MRQVALKNLDRPSVHCTVVVLLDSIRDMYKKSDLHFCCVGCVPFEVNVDKNMARRYVVDF